MVSLAALAAGAFPELFLPPHLTAGLNPPPALGVLLAAQAAFLLIFWPLLAGLRQGRPWASHAAATVGEYLLWLAVSAPLYLVAAWLADATAADVVRGVLYLSAVAAGAWGLTSWVHAERPVMTPAAVLLALLAAAGAPVACYLLIELTDAAQSVAWLRHAAPLTCAFTNAAPRVETWHPQPLWAWGLWPAVGLLAACAALLGRSHAESPP